MCSSDLVFSSISFPSSFTSGYCQSLWSVSFVGTWLHQLGRLLGFLQQLHKLGDFQVFQDCPILLDNICHTHFHQCHFFTMIIVVDAMSLNLLIYSIKSSPFLCLVGCKVASVIVSSPWKYLVQNTSTISSQVRIDSGLCTRCMLGHIVIWNTPKDVSPRLLHKGQECQ